MINIANIITITRIIFSLMMLCFPYLSPLFWTFYLLAGFSDMIDGKVARRLKIQSDFGAKLDSISDLVFSLCIAIVLIITISFPKWLMISIIVILIIKLISYLIGYYKYHQWSTLHTYLNKLVGLLIFGLPLLYWINPFVSELLISIISLLASIEELIITINSQELNRDCHCIFSLK